MIGCKYCVQHFNKKDFASQASRTKSPNITYQMAAGSRLPRSGHGIFFSFLLSYGMPFVSEPQNVNILIKAVVNESEQTEFESQFNNAGAIELTVT